MLGYPQKLVELLRAGGQSVLSGMPHRNNDEQANRLQIMTVDDLGKSADRHSPLVGPHRDGIVPVWSRFRILAGLNPGEGSEQSRGGEVDKPGKHRSLAWWSDEDRHRPGPGVG